MISLSLSLSEGGRCNTLKVASLFYGTISLCHNYDDKVWKTSANVGVDDNGRFFARIPVSWTRFATFRVCGEMAI